MIKIGQTIYKKYRIEQCLGKGGMSKVYLAYDIRLHSYWAIKEVVKRGKVYVNSLRAETQIILGLDHPALPRIVDIFEDEDTICLVMDYIQGKTLKALDAQNEETIINWGIQIAHALSYLHQQNPPIIYRDMKPENVMITKEGNIKIIDFGTARTFKEEQCKDTVILGTQGYAPPEQYRNQTDARSDIYALGMTLYYLLSQKHPQTFYPEEKFASPELQAIVCKCVEINPDDRFQTCQEVAEALQHPEGFKTMKQKKRRLYRNISIVFLFVTLLSGMHIVQMKHQEYDLLISTSSATIYEDKIKRYEKAIHLYPFKMEAYEKMLQTFEEDGKFTQEESDMFLDLYNAYHPKMRFQSQSLAKLNYHVGRMYFNYYPDTFSTRIFKAYSFFEENHKSNINFDEKNVSESYYEICHFYKQYIFQSIYTEEVSKKEYEKMITQSKHRLKQMEKESVYDQLAYYNALFMFLYDQEDSMQKAHVSKQCVETYMQEIYEKASHMKVQKEVSLQLQKEIIQLGGIR